MRARLGGTEKPSTDSLTNPEHSPSMGTTEKAWSWVSAHRSGGKHRAWPPVDSRSAVIPSPPLAENSPPYSSYAAILGTFVGGLAAAGALARALEKEPQRQTTLDFVLLAGATFKTARTLTHDRVASFVRQPFVEGEAGTGDERPAGDGGRRAIGELVTCTRCVGTWAAAGLASTQIVAPRFGRLLTWTLGAAAASDFLQAAFVSLTDRANAVEAAGEPTSARTTRKP